MKERIIKFLKIYLVNEELDKSIEKYGKFRTISDGLRVLIDAELFTKDRLRKELSIYCKRILSEHEFENML